MTSPLPGTTLSDNEQAALVYTLSDCFARRPTLESVAPGLVRDMLESEYPSLGERLAHAALIEPESCRDEVEYRVVTLVHLLIERFLGEGKLLCPAGSYLTLYPGAEHPQKLSLSVATLDTLLNEWAPLLPQAYKQALVDFWSTPSAEGVAPWQQLSEFFAEQLRQACAALSGDELGTVQAVLDYPDLKERQVRFGTDCAQAYIPIIDTRVKGPEPLHVQALVMSRWVGERQIVLLYTLFGGIEAFDSTQALESSLGVTLGGQEADFRSYSPDHHVFDALTVTLLIRQLEAIDAIRPGDYRDPEALEQQLRELTGLQALFGAFRSGHEAKLGRLRDLLPEDLRKASAADRTLYGRYVVALAAVYRRHAGKAFLDGIPDVASFAGASLQASLLEIYPQAATVSVSDISVTLTRVANPPLEMVDSASDVRYQTQTRDYVALALKNLAAFPLGASAQIRYQGQASPSWMTYEVLRTAVSDADIGRSYPELLRQKLQRDPVERARQEGLFSDYLRVLLPMLALELRFKRQLTETARLYVEAVVTQDNGVHQVRGQSLVVRPLAFLAQPQATADRVRTMFVIGPRATDQGPQVLCRPGSDVLLREFSSLNDLLTAIQAPGALQQSVLDGLDSTRRPIYDQGGFKEPHVIRVTPLDMDLPAIPAPASLDITELSGAFGAALFAATVEALIIQAEAVAVSDAEDRWNRFADLGWALFNLLAPFATGPLAEVGLLVQLMSSLKAFADPNASEPWAAFADVLLSLAVVLVYHRRPFNEPARTSVPVVPPIGNAVLKDPAIKVTSQLVFAWTRPDRQFTASELVRLESFKLLLDDSPGSLLESGEWKGLYQHDKLFYARVEGAWFRVSRRLDGVVIINDRHPARQGPWLRRDSSGLWRLDRGLRLLGGVGELSVRAAKKLKSLERKGRDLLATLPALLADAERTAKVVHSPLDIQHILETKAQPFEEVIQELRGLTRGLTQSPRTLIAELEEAASILANEGLNLRISLTRKALPTVTAIRFLREQEQITIRKLGGRRAIPGGKKPDFLEEYEIRDRQGRPLWYAHFHYDTASKPLAEYGKAHLKTLQQRHLGISFQSAQEAAGVNITPIWRGPIDAETAATLFLPLSG
ncbi:dermonecrotic toxin domain-containing protein [Pseudomonas gingeri]|uniref:Dermonecrotic toxin N-terminal domain-containing protein n=1 Tax=Pseudomonas gingeri TaxID=117681 RepID=A0A7Y7YE28_9PSED|nr:DUF6543 domain-containing protein [Pseudomonas gingeri]NWB28385.1 hypothetical protein [Pseudomonas gingeri]NWC34688.1 hypothetical protein [Pseudomonas gingeri]NWD51188.1 hypothetical protein [Pseudomonas gingeri]